MWLNKGLAMATVDGFAGQATVRTDTIEVFERSSRQASVTKYQDLKLDDQDAIVYQCVRGYWIARFFQDTQAELLKSVLSHRYSHDELETKLAAALGMDRDKFWSDIDGILLAHFKQGE